MNEPIAVPQPTQQRDIIHLPMGLLGFEQIKDYILLGRPEDYPFLWLRRRDDDDIAFLVVSPFEIEPTYQPDVNLEDTEFLGLIGQ